MAEQRQPERRSSVEQIIEAQEEERRKISRQIHDGPAQALSNFILQTEIALRLFDIDVGKAREELTSLKASATSTFSHVRDFIFDLRPMMLDDLGLIPTVRRYTDAFKEKTGLNLTLVVTGTERRLESHRGGAGLPGDPGAARQRPRIRPGDPGEGHARRRRRARCGRPSKTTAAASTRTACRPRTARGGGCSLCGTGSIQVGGTMEFDSRPGAKVPHRPAGIPSDSLIP